MSRSTVNIHFIIVVIAYAILYNHISCTKITHCSVNGVNLICLQFCCHIGVFFVYKVNMLNIAHGPVRCTNVPSRS